MGFKIGKSKFGNANIGKFPASKGRITNPKSNIGIPEFVKDIYPSKQLVGQANLTTGDCRRIRQKWLLNNFFKNLCQVLIKNKFLELSLKPLCFI